MLFNYTVSSSILWTSFDYGFVEAENYEEAKVKALKELTDNFNKANEAFRKCEDTKGFSVDFYPGFIKIEEATPEQIKNLNF
jgi:hypothetical protein